MGPRLRVTLACCLVAVGMGYGVRVASAAGGYGEGVPAPAASNVGPVGGWQVSSTVGTCSVPGCTIPSTINCFNQGLLNESADDFTCTPDSTMEYSNLLPDSGNLTLSVNVSTSGGTGAGDVAVYIYVNGSRVASGSVNVFPNTISLNAGRQLAGALVDYKFAVAEDSGSSILFNGLAISVSPSAPAASATSVNCGGGGITVNDCNLVYYGGGGGVSSFAAGVAGYSGGCVNRLASSGSGANAEATCARGAAVRAAVTAPGAGQICGTASLGVGGGMWTGLMDASGVVQAYQWITGANEQWCANVSSGLTYYVVIAGTAGGVNSVILSSVSFAAAPTATLTPTPPAVVERDCGSGIIFRDCNLSTQGAAGSSTVRGPYWQTDNGAPQAGNCAATVGGCPSLGFAYDANYSYQLVTPSQNGSLQMTAACVGGSGFTFGIYTPADVALSVVASGNGACLGTETAAYGVTAGASYRLFVEGTNGAGNPMRFNLSAVNFIVPTTTDCGVNVVIHDCSMAQRGAYWSNYGTSCQNASEFGPVNGSGLSQAWTVCKSNTYSIQQFVAPGAGTVSATFVCEWGSGMGYGFFTAANALITGGIDENGTCTTRTISMSVTAGTTYGVGFASNAGAGATAAILLQNVTYTTSSGVATYTATSTATNTVPPTATAAASATQTPNGTMPPGLPSLTPTLLPTYTPVPPYTPIPNPTSTYTGTSTVDCGLLCSCMVLAAQIIQTGETFIGASIESVAAAENYIGGGLYAVRDGIAGSGGAVATAIAVGGTGVYSGTSAIATAVAGGESAVATAVAYGGASVVSGSTTIATGITGVGGTIGTSIISATGTLNTGVLSGTQTLAAAIAGGGNSVAAAISGAGSGVATNIYSGTAGLATAVAGVSASLGTVGTDVVSSTYPLATAVVGLPMPVATAIALAGADVISATGPLGTAVDALGSSVISATVPVQAGLDTLGRDVSGAGADVITATAAIPTAIALAGGEVISATVPLVADWDVLDGEVLTATRALGDWTGDLDAIATDALSGTRALQIWSSDAISSTDALVGDVLPVLSGGSNLSLWVDDHVMGPCAGSHCGLNGIGQSVEDVASAVSNTFCSGFSVGGFGVCESVPEAIDGVGLAIGSADAAITGAGVAVSAPLAVLDGEGVTAGLYVKSQWEATLANVSGLPNLIGALVRGAILTQIVPTSPMSDFQPVVTTVRGILPAFPDFSAVTIGSACSPVSLGGGSGDVLHLSGATIDLCAAGASVHEYTRNGSIILIAVLATFGALRRYAGLFGGGGKGREGEE